MASSVKSTDFDPRVKLLLLVVAGWLAIYLPEASQLLTLTVISLVIPALSRISWLKLMGNMTPMALLLLTFSLLGAFLDPRLPALSLGPVHLSLPGILTALETSWRVIMVLWWAFWFTASTSVPALTMTMEWLLNPLQRLGINTSALVLALVVALRFIPELLTEGRLIREAQQLRGYRERSNQPLMAAKGLLVMIVPLLIRSWLRAEEMADAVLARGYRNGHSPVRLHTLRLSVLDLAAIASSLAFIYWAI